jgi:hypothetical protein
MFDGSMDLIVGFSWWLRDFHHRFGVNVIDGRYIVASTTPRQFVPVDTTVVQSIDLKQNETIQ